MNRKSEEFIECKAKSNSPLSIPQIHAEKNFVEISRVQICGKQRPQKYRYTKQDC